MTTLPQTTGARFPRAGARTANIPALAQANAGGPAAGAANSMGLADVLRVLRANLWLILLSTILALGLGWAVNQFILEPYYKRYTARAWLEVRMPSLVDPGINNTQVNVDKQLLEIRQKTLAQKLLSQDLWRPLLQQENIRSLGWFASYRDGGGLDQAKVLHLIEKNLSVNPTPQTELIGVALSAPSATDAQMVLDQIVRKLINMEQSDYRASQEQDRVALENMRRSLDLQIEGQLNVMNSASAILTSARAADSTSNGIGYVRQQELQQLVRERIEKEAVFNETMSAYQTFVQQQEQGITPVALDTMIDQMPAMQRLVADFDQAEMGLESTRAQLGEGNRQTQAVQANLNAITAKIDAKRAELRVTMGAAMKDQYTRSASLAKSELDQSTARIASLEKALGEIYAEQNRFNLAEQRHKSLTERKKQVDDRLAVIDANRNSQGSESRGSVKLWGNIVEMPKEQSFPDLRLTLGAAALLGLGLSVGIAFLREMMDSTVRSPRDIMKVGQLNLLGMIPHADDDPQAAAGDLNLIISTEPHSIISENFRQVRTRLQHTASLDTTRSLLITSPGPGDGKTTVACNIAAGLALNGRKILLVDANFRRPELHKVFGVGNDTGLGSVLSQAVSAESAIKKTNVPNLDVLPTGPRPANTTELLESQLLTDFIDRSLEEYDHVIFDTGPILLVSETVALAPRVDGVITVVRARTNSRGLLQRMRDALRQLKAEHLGVVLNGVRQHTGGYYARNIKNYYAYQNGDH